MPLSAWSQTHSYWGTAADSRPSQELHMIFRTCVESDILSCDPSIPKVTEEQRVLRLRGLGKTQEGTSWMHQAEGLLGRLEEDLHSGSPSGIWGFSVTTDPSQPTCSVPVTSTWPSCLLIWDFMKRCLPRMAQNSFHDLDAPPVPQQIHLNPSG